MIDFTRQALEYIKAKQMAAKVIAQDLHRWLYGQKPADQNKVMVLKVIISRVNDLAHQLTSDLGYDQIKFFGEMKELLKKASDLWSKGESSYPESKVIISDVNVRFREFHQHQFGVLVLAAVEGALRQAIIEIKKESQPIFDQKPLAPQSPGPDFIE